MPQIVSALQTGGAVPFPAHVNERVYMREITKGKLPEDLARWQPTVDAMLNGIDFEGPAYLMVDQGEVSAGETHRRGGWHVDGYWNPELKAHQQGHTATPRRGGHNGGGGGHGSGVNTWAEADFKEPEMLLLASDVAGCRVALGEFEVTMKDGGDCAGVDVAGMDVKTLEPGRVHLGNISLLHESIPLVKDTKRTLVRINIPGITVH